MASAASGGVTVVIMKKNARILAIAPYDGLRDIFVTRASRFPSISLDVFVGNLYDAIKELDRIHSGDYDIIISRGGTAKMLRQISNTPVVEVDISMYDMLRTVQIAQQYGRNFMIMGFDNITHTARILCEIMQYNINICEVKSEEDIAHKLKEAASLEIGLIVGDVITVEAAQKAGFNALLINSGPESVDNALQEACNLFGYICGVNNDSHAYKAIVDKCPYGIAYIDDDGQKEYANPKFQQYSAGSIRSLFHTDVQTVQSGDAVHVLKSIGNTTYDFFGARLDDGISKGCIFYASNAFVSDAPSYLSIEQLSACSKPFCLFDPDKLEEFRRISSVMASNARFCIFGEPGTGKSALARYLHFQCNGSASILVTVDCGLLDESNWTAAMRQLSDLLQNNQGSVFLRNVNCLSFEKQRQLAMIIQEHPLLSGSLIICSIDTSLNSDAPERQLASPLYKVLNSFCFSVLPLRECPQTIPAICSLLIGQYNTEYGKQIIGFEADAMQLMTEYDWELNYAQLCQTVKQLAATTAKVYIPRGEVAALLTRQRDNRPLPIDLTGDLDQIERQIISQVLEEEGMNQSKAARRLGISRSTLWRKIKI